MVCFTLPFFAFLVNKTAPKSGRLKAEHLAAKNPTNLIGQFSWNMFRLHKITVHPTF